MKTYHLLLLIIAAVACSNGNPRPKKDNGKPLDGALTSSTGATPEAPVTVASENEEVSPVDGKVVYYSCEGTDGSGPYRFELNEARTIVSVYGGEQELGEAVVTTVNPTKLSANNLLDNTDGVNTLVFDLEPSKTKEKLAGRLQYYVRDGSDKESLDVELECKSSVIEPTPIPETKKEEEKQIEEEQEEEGMPVGTDEVEKSNVGNQSSSAEEQPLLGPGASLEETHPTFSPDGSEMQLPMH